MASIDLNQHIVSYFSTNPTAARAGGSRYDPSGVVRCGNRAPVVSLRSTTG